MFWVAVGLLYLVVIPLTLGLCKMAAKGDEAELKSQEKIDAP